MVIKREIKTTLPMSIEEQAMLQRLADAEGISTAQWLRTQIRTAHQKKFGSTPAHTTPATLRGLITDLNARAKYDAGGIAKRMGVDVGVVLDALSRLEKRGLVEREEFQGADSLWNFTRVASTEDYLADAEAKRFDLDAVLDDE